MGTFEDPRERGNDLLSALSDADFNLVRPSLVLLPMVHGHCVFEPGAPAPFTWFPVSGMISIVALANESSAIEVARVGRLGMSGIATVQDSGTMIYRAMVQVPGEGWRIETSTFSRILGQRPAIKLLLMRMSASSWPRWDKTRRACIYMNSRRVAPAGSLKRRTVLGVTRST